MYKQEVKIIFNLSYLLQLITVLKHATSTEITHISPRDSIEFFRDFFNLYSVDVKNMDQFQPTKGCKSCPYVYYPVCGDDNITYTNECKLVCLNTLKNKEPKVKMVRTGPCFVFPDL